MAIRLPDPLPIVTIDVSRPIWRVHETGFGAIWYGRRVNNRFDDPAAGYGALYLGESPSVAVLETLVRGSDRCVVEQRKWDSCSISSVHLAEELQLMQFEGSALRRFGVGAERAHAGVYTECQELSATLHARHLDVDGIQFRSRWDTSKLCWVVFDRAAHKIRDAGTPQPLKGSKIGDRVLDECGITFV
ncbi:MAG TPA: RES family NAD+ phosphorylase [Longimicrobium sp.]|nr:RES family NAD+ phosphorylase [Longimicrobium sp.]